MIPGVGWLRGKLQRVQQRIVHSSLWLWLFKLYKYLWRTLFHRPSQLERLCWEAAARAGSRKSHFHTAYPVGTVGRWTSWMVTTVTRLLQRFVYPAGYLSLPAYGTHDDDDDDHDDDDDEGHSNHSVVHRTGLSLNIPSTILYQIDRSILYSTQLTVYRRQLESKETVDIFSIYSNILQRKCFTDIATNVDSTTMNCSNQTTTNCSNNNNTNSIINASNALYIALLHIHCTFRLLYDLNDRSSTRFDSTNKLHERRLHDLFTTLLPGQSLPNRLSTDWQRLGFQGKDPATDFRGMGVLGLDHLLWFARRHSIRARQSLHDSWDESGWYSWACVGINITSFLLDLLRARMLQLYLYTALERWTAPSNSTLGTSRALLGAINYSNSGNSNSGNSGNNNGSSVGERWLENNYQNYLERLRETAAKEPIKELNDRENINNRLAATATLSASGSGNSTSSSTIRRRSAESESGENDAAAAFLREAMAELYSYTFDRFNDYWRTELPSLLLLSNTASTQNRPAILEFPRLFKQFKLDMEEHLLSGRITYDSISQHFIN